MLLNLKNLVTNEHVLHEVIIFYSWHMVSTIEWMHEDTAPLSLPPQEIDQWDFIMFSFNVQAVMSSLEN